MYQFSLLSIVDTDLIRIAFGKSTPKAREIESENYVASYIIKKKEEFSKIRFIKASSFENAIRDYDQLHKFNCEVFSEFCDGFYKDIFKDWDRVQILIGDFREMVSWRLHWRIYKQFNERIDINNIQIGWRDKQGDAVVRLPVESRHLEFLNEDKDAKSTVRDALIKIYRYSGEFIFDEEDIPF